MRHRRPERPQRDGLAAGVRARDHERRVAVAEAEVDRDDAARQARVARRQQHDLGPVGRLGPDAVELGGEVRLGRPEVELGQRLERLAAGACRWRRRAPTARRGSAPPPRPPRPAPRARRCPARRRPAAR